MLSRLIVTFYGVLLEACLWIILVGSFLSGWIASGFFAALGALLVAFVVCVAFFGAFLVLNDIHKSVRTIETRKSSGP